MDVYLKCSQCGCMDGGYSIVVSDLVVPIIGWAFDKNMAKALDGMPPRNTLRMIQRGLNKLHERGDREQVVVQKAIETLEQMREGFLRAKVGLSVCVME